MPQELGSDLPLHQQLQSVGVDQQFRGLHEYYQEAQSGQLKFLRKTRLQHIKSQVKLNISLQFAIQNMIADEQEWALKTDLDWEDVTPFVQARHMYNGDSKSILRAVRMIFQLECKECYCTEMHVASMGSLLIGCYTHMAVRWNSEKVKS